MVAFYSTATATAPLAGIFTLSIDSVTTCTTNNLPYPYYRRDSFRLESVSRQVDSFIGQMKIWLAYASERARARRILERQLSYARRLEPAPEAPPRPPRGRVLAGSNRYRVMFY